MRNRTALAAAALLAALSLFSCDIDTLAPRESEGELARLGSGAPSLATSSSPTASRGAGRGLDLDEEGCARSPGYWCHKEGQAVAFATDALALLSSVGVVLSEAELLEAVCDTRHQLRRHLASLALNLAAGFVSGDDPLTGGDSAIGDVMAAFEMAAAVFLDSTTTRQERNDAKDVLDRINNNQNIDNECTGEPGDGEEEEEEEGEGEGPTTNANPNAGGPQGGGPPPPSATACPLEPNGKMTICHLPPGNPLNPKTIQIAPSAWPAHEAHGDICPPCS